MRGPAGAGALDRRVRFERNEGTENALGETVFDWGALHTVWGELVPVGDAERWEAGQVTARRMARVRVRWSDASAGVTAADRLVIDSEAWAINGIKELGRRRWIEFTVQRAE